MSIPLKTLNQMDQAEFTQVLGDIFEHTPAIAQQTWPQRPFATVEALHQAMVTVMQALTTEDQLRLIRAHPDLGTKAKMADASVQEQAGVGLDQLSPEEFATLAELNQAYRDRFHCRGEGTHQNVDFGHLSSAPNPRQRHGTVHGSGGNR